MILDGVDITQLVSLLGLATVIVRLWVLHKARDKEMKENAVETATWKLNVEHQIELLKTQGCKDTSSISDAMKEFRKEVKEDHEEVKNFFQVAIDKLDSKLEKFRDELNDKIDNVEKEARDGRSKIYDSVEKIRNGKS